MDPRNLWYNEAPVYLNSFLFLEKEGKQMKIKLFSIKNKLTWSLQSSIAAYIRLFEPLVIKALKQYTITSQVELQQQVLNLLSHLVQLRVNYCLLDSDQVRLVLEWHFRIFSEHFSHFGVFSHFRKFLYLPLFCRSSINNDANILFNFFPISINYIEFISIFGF